MPTYMRKGVCLIASISWREFNLLSEAFEERTTVTAPTIAMHTPKKSRWLAFSIISPPDVAAGRVPFGNVHPAWEEQTHNWQWEQTRKHRHKTRFPVKIHSIYSPQGSHHRCRSKCIGYEVAQLANIHQDKPSPPGALMSTLEQFTQECILTTA